MTQDNDLILHLTILGLINEVDNPTKSVQKLYSKLRKKLTLIRKNQSEHFTHNNSIKNKLWAEAWNDTFSSKTASKTISIGTIMDNLYPHISKPLVGKQVIQKASDSFYFSEEDIPLSTIESSSNDIATAFLNQLGIKQSNKLKLLKSTIYNTLVLEGKLT